VPSELLKNLMEQADQNQLVLPDFQRDFVWKPADVTKLVASLMNGYPIGGLLFMESPGIYGHRPLDGVAPNGSGKSNGDTRLILDGQQRLTSCYRAFFGGVNVERHAGRYYFDYGNFFYQRKRCRTQTVRYIQRASGGLVSIGYHPSRATWYKL
jgi:hypothetical protein